jgi:hypothetical protein
MTQKQNCSTPILHRDVKVIAGEDISVYDAAVDAWKAGGGDDITKEVNDWYAKNSKPRAQYPMECLSGRNPLVDGEAFPSSIRAEIATSTRGEAT